MEEENIDFGCVNVIIPTHNRFTSLILAIRSVQAQTYKNIKIIVVNDGSTDQKYYTHKWENEDRVECIHLEKNSKEKFGFPCVAYVRNIGLKNLTKDCEYFCNLDDDDTFCDKNKIIKQILAMKKNGVRMSSTNAKKGNGFFHSRVRTVPFHGPDVKLPKIFTKETIIPTNYIICSSIMIHVSLIKDAGMFPEISIRSFEDYEYWKECLKHTNSVYIPEECVYYDMHGGIKKW